MLRCAAVQANRVVGLGGGQRLCRELAVEIKLKTVSDRWKIVEAPENCRAVALLKRRAWSPRDGQICVVRYSLDEEHRKVRYDLPMPRQSVPSIPETETPTSFLEKNASSRRSGRK